MEVDNAITEAIRHAIAAAACRRTAAIDDGEGRNWSALARECSVKARLALGAAAEMQEGR